MALMHQPSHCPLRLLKEGGCHKGFQQHPGQRPEELGSTCWPALIRQFTIKHLSDAKDLVATKRARFTANHFRC